MTIQNVKDFMISIKREDESFKDLAIRVANDPKLITELLTIVPGFNVTLLLNKIQSDDFIAGF